MFVRAGDADAPRTAPRTSPTRWRRRCARCASSCAARVGQGRHRAAFKDTLAEHKLKMPQLAVPVRVAVCGRVQTPAIDAVLALFDRDVVLRRLAEAA